MNVIEQDCVDFFDDDLDYFNISDYFNDLIIKQKYDDAINYFNTMILNDKNIKHILCRTVCVYFKSTDELYKLADFYITHEFDKIISFGIFIELSYDKKEMIKYLTNNIILDPNKILNEMIDDIELCYWLLDNYEFIINVNILKKNICFDLFKKILNYDQTLEQLIDFDMIKTHLLFHYNGSNDYLLRCNYLMDIGITNNCFNSNVDNLFVELCEHNCIESIKILYNKIKSLDIHTQDDVAINTIIRYGYYDLFEWYLSVLPMNYYDKIFEILCNYDYTQHQKAYEYLFEIKPEFKIKYKLLTE